MNKEEIAITVVVAVYNGSKTLQRCITSIATQTHINKELIIIDGGSTDGTLEILHANAAHIAYWESEPDRGIYHAWNKALNYARGGWVCFLGSDDYFWGSDVLGRMANYLVGVLTNTGLVYGQLALVDEHSEVIRYIGEPWEHAKKKLCLHMPIPHAGALHRRVFFDLHGKFDETFRIAGDYELFLRLTKTHDIEFIPNIIVLGMQYGGISCDTEYQLTILLENARARRKNYIKQISYQWVMDYFKALFRKLLRLIISERGVRYFAIMRGRLTGQTSTWEQLSTTDNSRRPNAK